MKKGILGLLLSLALLIFYFFGLDWAYHHSDGWLKKFFYAIGADSIVVHIDEEDYQKALEQSKAK